MTAPTPAPPVELAVVDAWWRAANYLSVAQIYLTGNALLREELRPEHIKPRLLGHWGTIPALNLVYAHLNRLIVERDLELMYVCGPGHGGQALVSNGWLEHTYSELFPGIPRDGEGMQRLARQFSFPGGIPSHAAPETPGSINEGGELGYSLAHAYGMVLDNPDLVAACVIGDGEAETGPLATAWHLGKLVSPATDGAVLPILNLNGYKIANPTLLARMPEDDLRALLTGYGYAPIVVSGEEPAAVHRDLAAALDEAVDAIHAIQRAAREEEAGPDAGSPRWPMIVLRTPKGWTGPAEVDGLPVEGTWRAHQVPIDGVRTDDAHRAALVEWLRSYRPDELFDERGVPRDVLDPLVPPPHRRMSASEHANGGLRAPLVLPPLDPHAVEVTAARDGHAGATPTLGPWLREVVRANPDSFRLFGPDEVASNKLDAVYEATDKVWGERMLPVDEHLARRGRVVEMLSEHSLEGLLEGYTLSGRHGLFTSYEAFIHIVDSMVNQHAKWIESAREVPWRRPVAALNHLLSSHVWRQDHNGFSHQDPGFMNLVANKQAALTRIYLPADANTLLVTMEKVLGETDVINVVTAGKHPEPAWLSLAEARTHLERGISEWDWAGTATGAPDVVLACAGDVPTLETVAAAALLRQRTSLAVRVVNVVDLFRLQDADRHPHGMEHDAFDALFTSDRPVVFAFHGYASLVHELTYRRANHAGFHVHGFRERGTTTTPFDMVMLNDLDRYALAIDALRRVPGAAEGYGGLAEEWEAERADARAYAYREGLDRPDIDEWGFSAEHS